MTWIPSGLFQRLINAENPESPKAAVLIIACLSLCLIVGSIGLGCSIRIFRAGDLGTGAVTALLGALGVLAGLAGFHKIEDPSTNKDNQ